MYIAGIDIGGTTIKCGVIKKGQGLVDSVKIPTVRENAAAVIEIIASFIRESVHPMELVGVGTAGWVNTEKDRVSAANLGWLDVPLRQELAQRTGLPVWVDNDAQAAMAAECLDGALAGVKNAVYVTLGTGVGGALLIDGRPWRGRDNCGAEIGHIITHGDGLPCPCGRRGCYELYASAQALSRLTQGQKSAKEVIDAARAGDSEMSQLFHQYVREICLGLVSLEMVFSPEVFVFGGGVSGAGDFLLDALKRCLTEEYASVQAPFRAQLRIAQHRNDAGMLGAAALAEYHIRHTALG